MILGLLLYIWSCKNSRKCEHKKRVLRSAYKKSVYPQNLIKPEIAPIFTRAHTREAEMQRNAEHKKRTLEKYG